MSQFPKSSFFEILAKEADALLSIEEMEKYLEQKKDFAYLPVQPVFLALKKMSDIQVAGLLPRFSLEQRQAFLDIDCWKRDEIDTQAFSFWINAYSHCSDDQVRLDFAKSESFLLYLKGKFNIWTFDAEDPQYPDHDYYFLTDDSLLLFEYDEEIDDVDEIKDLIRMLYSDWGVEKAYTFLFKLVSDSYSLISEEEYRFKKERLRDYGMVDYYEALELLHPFPSISHLEQFIKRKVDSTPEIDDVGKMQNLHFQALTSYRDQLSSLSSELSKIQDEKRLNYLRFSFIRLVNSSLSAQEALKEGSMLMTKIGNQTKHAMLLGQDYLKAHYFSQSNQSLFERFDFVDMYRIGKTLFSLELKELKKNLRQYQFINETESFLGKFWEEFLDDSFDDLVKFKSPQNQKTTAIVDVHDFELWKNRARSLNELLPFASQFFKTFKLLENEGKVQDSFYLNYTVDSIDLEAILLSSFAHFVLETFQEENIYKMGLTIDEFKSFVQKIITSEGKFVLTPEIFQLIKNFSKKFGLDQVYDFESYLQAILKDQLEGYEYQNLEHEDYSHVGGPIILNVLKH